jgi:hypothetical protein
MAITHISVAFLENQAETPWIDLGEGKSLVGIFWVSAWSINTPTMVVTDSLTPHEGWSDPFTFQTPDVHFHPRDGFRYEAIDSKLVHGLRHVKFYRGAETNNEPKQFILLTEG